MRNRWKKMVSILTVCVILCGSSFAVSAKDGISAQSYILMEASTGKVLEVGNENTALPMASTTKIMTALLTLEQPDLDQFFTVDTNAITVEGSSMGLLPDDQVSLRALAYGMLLPSGNDAATMAAVKIAGSVEKFAVWMNQRAEQIGMKNTHFVTPSGLHDEDHYSTAYDMALLAREALKNKDFAEICKSKKAKLEFGNPPFPRWLSNHNKLLDYYDGCIGLKTGFTKTAGRCLVSAAERDGVTLICVTLNASNDWQDHTALLDRGFAQVSMKPLTPDLNNVKIKLVGALTGDMSVTVLEQVQAFVSEEELSRLEQRVFLQPFYYAPVKQGDIVGDIQFLLDGKEVARATLLAGETAERNITQVKHGWWYQLKHFVTGLLEKKH